MPDKKQIEEMAKDKEFKKLVKLIENTHPFYVETIAERVYKKYQPKLPEDSVVLTREEHKKLKHGSGTLEQLYNQYPYRVLVGFNSMVFSQDRESYEKLYDEIEDGTRKETAREIIEYFDLWLGEDFEEMDDNGFIHIMKNDFVRRRKELAKQFDVEVE